MSFDSAKGRHQQNGVVLLSVLILLLVLTILVSSFSTFMERKLDTAVQSSQKLRELANVKAQQSELLYLLATSRVSPAGLSMARVNQFPTEHQASQFTFTLFGNEIRTDGHYYLNSVTQVRYSIQNARGLIGINSATQYWLDKFLQGLNINPISRRQLLDEIVDYADEDNWTKPYGRERSQDYFPENYLLQDCSELNRMPAWRANMTILEQLKSLCFPSRISSINVNAIPLDLWAVFWPESVSKLRQMRNDGRWFLSVSDAVAVEPSLLSVQEELLAVIGNQDYVINVNSEMADSKLHVTVGRGSAPPIIFR